MRDNAGTGGKNARPKKFPERKCVGCGVMDGKKSMLRVVRDKDGDVSLDPSGKRAGRGAYIHKEAGCLKTARKKKSLERALKCRIPDKVRDLLDAEIIGSADFGAPPEKT